MRTVVKRNKREKLLDRDPFDKTHTQCLLFTNLRLPVGQKSFINMCFNEVQTCTQTQCAIMKPFRVWPLNCSLTPFAEKSLLATQ